MQFFLSTILSLLFALQHLTFTLNDFKHKATPLKLKSNEIHYLEAEKSDILISKNPKKNQ